MRLPKRSLPRVGRRLGRALVVVTLALCGGATAIALGVGDSSSDDGATITAERAVRPQPIVAPAIVVASTTPAKPRRAERRKRKGKRGTADYYRRIAERRVPASAKSAFMPLYREAARTYGIDWRLVASVHSQETAFSSAPSTYRGLNDFGCCAGPMQFNVTNGPPSTWKLFRAAFRDGDRPKRYPHRTDHHPSIYDDFDAIMAAGKLLEDAGAGAALDGSSWVAAYSYYGRDLYGVTYANTVLARAVGWKRRGFCLNCDVDSGLVARYEADFGAAERGRLIAADRRRARAKAREKREKERRKREREREKRERRERADREDGRPRDRSPSPDEDRPAPKKRPTTTTPPPPTSTPPTPTPTTPAPPPPPGKACDGVKELLGC